MSSFSSVVQKPGKKIVPKAVPRRNVQKKTAPDVTSNTAPAPAAEGSGQAPERQSQTPTLESTPTTWSDTPGIPDPASIRNKPGIQPTIGQQGTVVEPTINIEDPPPPPEARPLVQANSPPTVTITESRARSTEHTETIEEISEESNDDIPSTNSSMVQSTNVPRGEKRQISRVASSDTDSIQRDPSEPEQPVSIQRPSAPGNAMSERSTGPQRVNKRRKTTPRAAPMLALAQSSSVASESRPSTSSTTAKSQSRSRDNQGQTMSDLLSSATRGAASISELAKSIESQTRALQPRTSQEPVDPTSTQHELQTSQSSTAQASRARRTRGQKTVEKQVAEIVANAMGKKKGSARKKAATPEDAENYELEPAKVTMGELCQDQGLGKKSALESEMQANWSEILQRRKEDRERAKSNAEKRRRKGYSVGNVDLPREPVAALAPSMTIVNGVIVVDQASREIDRDAQLQATAAQDTDNVREDKDYYKYINSGTVGMKPGRGSHFRWDPVSNERFFKGLRLFGTDFLMIANMFPGLTRKQIKTKFIREENADKARVHECLRAQEQTNLEEYAEMASMDTEEFQTLDSIQKDLEEQERQLREEDNQRRRREGFISGHEGDQVQPSVEGDGEGSVNVEDGVGDGGGDGGGGDGESNRFDSIARAIVQAAVEPKKRQRKATSKGVSKRNPKNNRRPEGVEEVLGNIDEVAV